ncbi:endo-1,4-beta-xylanase [Deinococcus sp.]|uniref:endo-1,4-beta-xylanase n=1 Tax=Deinococcus sp. TaxID=47478 RepID=UPI0025DC7623|nr:endo-1,4-beta-xylanase [Deinococcus sp.]
MTHPTIHRSLTLPALLLISALLLGACSTSAPVSQSQSEQSGASDPDLIETQAVKALPAGGADVLGEDTFAAFQNSPSSAVKLENIAVSGLSFTQAWRVTGLAPLEQPYFSQLSARSVAAIKKGDVMVVQFWARSVGGPAQTEFVLESGDTYEPSAVVSVQLSPRWRLYSAPFKALLDFAAGNGAARFRLGYDAQSFELGGVVLKNYGPGVPLSSLPSAGFTYAGRSASAPWRAAAAARIEQLRKGDVTVKVQDAAGNPVSGAAIKLDMQRHAFPFGTSVTATTLFEPSPDGQKYQDIIPTLFNRVALESDLKWPDYEDNKPLALRALDFFASKGIPVRGHNLVWPCEQDYCLPGDVPGLFGNPAALKKRIDDHFADILGATRGKIVEWDVINEPSALKRISKVLGEDEMAAQLTLAKKLDPAARMVINDANNLGEGNSDVEFKRILRRMQALNAPLEGIGLQSHFGYKLTPPAELNTRLDGFGELGVPLSITEFDVNVTDESLQADYLRDFMTVMFSNKNVSSFTMWGFWEGNHWLPNAALYRQDWSIKPNGQAFKDLIFWKWWTRASGQTSAAGTYSTRGFYGDYKLSVTVGGTTTTQDIKLTPGMGEVVVRR